MTFFLHTRLPRYQPHVGLAVRVCMAVPYIRLFRPLLSVSHTYLIRTFLGIMLLQTLCCYKLESNYKLTES